MVFFVCFCFSQKSCLEQKQIYINRLLENNEPFIFIFVYLFAWRTWLKSSIVDRCVWAHDNFKYGWICQRTLLWLPFVITEYVILVPIYDGEHLFSVCCLPLLFSKLLNATDNFIEFMTVLSINRYGNIDFKYTRKHWL